MTSENNNLEYLTVAEAAEIARVSEATIRHWLYIRSLPHYKPGRRVLIRASDLQGFMESGYVPAMGARARP